MRFLSILLPVLSLACNNGGTGQGDGDSAGSEGFCDSLNGGGTYEVLDGGGNASSGVVAIRLLTTESTDIHDPLYIAFKDFTLENVDAGGVQTIGKTSGDGLVSQLVG